MKRRRSRIYTVTSKSKIPCILFKNQVWWILFFSRWNKMLPQGISNAITNKTCSDIWKKLILIKANTNPLTNLKSFPALTNKSKSSSIRLVPALSLSKLWDLRPGQTKLQRQLFKVIFNISKAKLLKSRTLCTRYKLNPCINRNTKRIRNRLKRRCTWHIGVFQSSKNL